MTKYFGVVTEREYIKINKGTDRETRKPFWEFLDEQPGGWLSSIVYLQKGIDYPKTEAPIIFDCGAWSYKDKAIPKIGKFEVTSEWTVTQYQKYGKANDFVVAPDHMFISEEVIEERREFNRKSTIEFLPLAKAVGFRPMAVVHGVDIEERVARAHELVELGYDAISLGGLAFMAQGGSKKGKEKIIKIVETIRQEVPDIWLHVLGVSAPSFASKWQEFGVNSFDGASPFLKAFMGDYYVANGSKMKRHSATKVCRETRELLGEITAPLCDCKACITLRNEGIDTRTFGSNENNMGRAAHNLNQLMAAQKAAMNAVTSSEQLT